MADERRRNSKEKGKKKKEARPHGAVYSFFVERLTRKMRWRIIFLVFEDQYGKKTSTAARIHRYDSDERKKISSSRTFLNYWELTKTPGRKKKNEPAAYDKSNTHVSYHPRQEWQPRRLRDRSRGAFYEAAGKKKEKRNTATWAPIALYLCPEVPKKKIWQDPIPVLLDHPKKKSIVRTCRVPALLYLMAKIASTFRFSYKRRGANGGDAMKKKKGDELKTVCRSSNRSRIMRARRFRWAALIVLGGKGREKKKKRGKKKGAFTPVSWMQKQDQTRESSFAPLETRGKKRKKRNGA